MGAKRTTQLGTGVSESCRCGGLRSGFGWQDEEAFRVAEAVLSANSVPDFWQLFFPCNIGRLHYTGGFEFSIRRNNLHNSSATVKWQV